MDEELTAGYSEPCPRCSELLWGVTEEGHFYCKNCHNVIEVSHTCPGSINKDWVVCEGFQFILKAQAEALVNLGVNHKFKTWFFFSRTRQAYTHTPEHTVSFRLAKSHPGLHSDSGSGLDSELSDWSGCTFLELSGWSTGSVDSNDYVSRSGKKRRGQMSMRKTLALLHVALVWSRQKITLTDLLCLVEQGLVPYLHAYECFPEEMKMNNRDGLIFRVQSMPTYSMIHSESKDLIKLLQLPSFPPISLQSPLHPLNLSRRYLTELNLPDEMAKWVEFILDQADLMISKHLTVDPSYRPKPRFPHYELLAAAAIIVSMKLLFGLDDKTEWYFYFVLGLVWSGFSPVLVHRGEAGSVHFLWGQSHDADGRSMHHMTLKGGTRTIHDNLLSDKNYWHPPFMNCHRCKEHFSSLKEDVPRMFLWLLELFSFILHLKVDILFEAVVRLERKLFKIPNSRNRKKAKRLKKRRIVRRKIRSDPRSRRSRSQP
uniref:TATA box-binding protein-associated factor RNA polymerase I subunit B n=1 Tax=Periophthalmus magnuspinnatus TaxID=409849 RepID=A0A3B3ZTN2_9GOBI